VKISMKPIAFFHSSHTKAYEAPRQAVLASSSEGWFELDNRFSKESLEDLEGFDFIWLIYSFHQNHQWKQKVRPPRASEKKRSVFATRSPYRPNGLGLSCVQLEKIEDKKVFVSCHDLLDGTPILDIKPYIPYADSFPSASVGWLEGHEAFGVEFESQALEKALWLENNLQTAVRNIVSNQLAYEPTNSKAKRVKKHKDFFIFSLRTWRFCFHVFEKKVVIFDVMSGYSEDELALNTDPHKDKGAHRLFENQFNS